ncbi:MAG: hypothetical protein ABEJ81_01395 [Haloferacaceae archaeon]
MADTATHGSGDGAAVMGAVDAAEFVIAAVDRDGAWLSMPEARAPSLDDWR